MSTRSALLNGLRLSYEEEGNGPALVFLHGAGGGAIEWAPIVPYFLDSYTCYALDHRGSGGSDSSASNDYWLETLVQEVLAFLAEVSGPAIVVGHSQGGILAMIAASREPALVRGIFAEDIVPQSLTKERIAGPDVAAIYAAFRWFSSCAEARDRESQSLVLFAHHLGQMPAGKTTLGEVLGPIGLQRLASWFYETRPALFAEEFMTEHLTAEDVSRILAGLVCPLHVAYGDTALGGLVQQDDLEAILSAGVDMTATHFPGTGHSIAGLAPHAYLEDLRAFLKRVEGEGG